MLPAAIQAEILRLTYAERWPLSRIARHLGINRKSVRKVAARRSVALTPAPPRPRTTGLTPFRARIQALLAEDPERSAVNILRREPRLWRGPLAARGEAAHAPGGWGDRALLVREPPRGAAPPLLAAWRRGDPPRPRRRAPGHQARRAGPLEGQSPWLCLPLPFLFVLSPDQRSSWNGTATTS